MGSKKPKDAPEKVELAEEPVLAAHHLALAQSDDDPPPKPRRVRRPRRRARLTCYNGHIWPIRGVDLSLMRKGRDEYWDAQRCPYCKGRILAAVTLKGGRVHQHGIFHWVVRCGDIEYRTPVNRTVEQAAIARLLNGLRGGNQPILTRAKTNGKRNDRR